MRLLQTLRGRPSASSGSLPSATRLERLLVDLETGQRAYVDLARGRKHWGEQRRRGFG